MSAFYQFYRGTPLVKTYVAFWGRRGTPECREVSLTMTAEEAQREAFRIGRENGWGAPTGLDDA